MELEAPTLSAPALLKWGAAIVAAQWLQVPALVRTLLVLMLLDYISGIATAFVRSELASSKGMRGLVKKSLVLLLLVALHIGEKALGINFELESVVAFAYSVNEIVSLVENCARAGVPIPEPLVSALMKTKNLRTRASQSDIDRLGR